MHFLEVLAHGGEEVTEVLQPALDEVVRSNSIKFSLLAGGLILILTIFSILLKEKNEWLKYILFGGLVLVILANTIYLSGSTIYLNQKSTTGGPVHYHADFQIWNCGKEIELANPKGLSNKIGTSVVHEHNDKRIHIEGVILENHQASLEHFFESVGGSFDGNHLAIPTNEGIVNLENGNKCPDGKVGTLQVFVYTTEGSNFSQKKIDNAENYVISPHSIVPPGDCVIIEFDRPKDKTDKICTFYEVARKKGELLESSR